MHQVAHMLSCQWCSRHMPVWAAFEAPSQGPRRTSCVPRAWMTWLALVRMTWKMRSSGCTSICMGWTGGSTSRVGVDSSSSHKGRGARQGQGGRHSITGVPSLCVPHLVDGVVEGDEEEQQHGDDHAGQQHVVHGAVVVGCMAGRKRRRPGSGDAALHSH